MVVTEGQAPCLIFDLCVWAVLHFLSFYHSILQLQVQNITK